MQKDDNIQVSSTHIPKVRNMLKCYLSKIFRQKVNNIYSSMHLLYIWSSIVVSQLSHNRKILPRRNKTAGMVYCFANCNDALQQQHERAVIQ